MLASNRVSRMMLIFSKPPLKSLKTGASFHASLERFPSCAQHPSERQHLRPTRLSLVSLSPQDLPSEQVIMGISLLLLRASAPQQTALLELGEDFLPTY